MTYDFKCLVCRSNFSLELSMKEYSSKSGYSKLECPICGSKNIHRLYFSIPIIYKDSDFTKHVERDNDD